MSVQIDRMADQDDLYMVYTHVRDYHTSMQVFTGGGALERAQAYKAKEQETYVYVRLVHYTRVAEL
jgi:hypothetical protein